MSLRLSLFYRLERVLARHEVRRTLKQYRLSGAPTLPLDFVRAMATTSRYLRKATVLLDIGAHKGLFARTANVFFPFEKTICFEPNGALHETLRRNTSAFDCIVSAYALADKEGSRTYYLHQDDSMNSLVESSSQVLRDEFPFDNPDLVSQTKIDTCRLDQFVETHRLADRWFMIKIDTQGNELEILKHGTKTLARTEACVVEFMFLTPYRMSYNFADLVTFMDGHGFVCQGALTIARRPSQRISAVDFLFVRHL